MLRSIGFDRCPPTLIDILTDIYIRHLQLLASECISLADLQGRREIKIQDITQSLENIGMIKPTNILDIYDQYEGPNKGAENFLLWVVGSIPENSRVVSKPTPEMLNTNKVKSNPVIPEYINALNNRQDPDEINGDALRNDQQRQQQQQQDEILDDDWLKFLMKKQSKIGHEERFKNTILNTQTSNSHSDYTVVGPRNEKLEEKLPYNIRYEEDDEDEDINIGSRQQSVEYRGDSYY